MRIGFGFRHHVFRPHFHTRLRSTERPTRTRCASSAASRRSKPQPEKKAVPLVKFADGTGRQFDPASKVWFDGKSQCFSGKQQFTFKNDAWFYGSSKWTEIQRHLEDELRRGARARELRERAVVRGQGQRLHLEDGEPGRELQGRHRAAGEDARRRARRRSRRPRAQARAEIAKAAPALTECKKYFPSIGQMLVVPCGE